MKEAKDMTNEQKKTNQDQFSGKWMAPGIGIGATLGVFFGNFVLGPAIGSHSIGFIIGMSMGAGVGLVLGLSLGSAQN